MKEDFFVINMAELTQRDERSRRVDSCFQQSSTVPYIVILLEVCTANLTTQDAYPNYPHFEYVLHIKNRSGSITKLYESISIGKYIKHKRITVTSKCNFIVCIVFLSGPASLSASVLLRQTRNTLLWSAARR